MTVTLAALCALAAQAAAQDSARRVITEPVPSAYSSVKNLHRVVAANTPSGFEVPRYVSLKYGKTNGRKGPSANHPIVWQYRRVGLPVIIVAETENWRKIRDIGGDESWIYKAGLSGERHVITTAETPLHKRKDNSSLIIALAEKGTLLRLEACEEARCKVFSKDGTRGWVNKSKLWGAEALF
jgi:SH3-like domain-containing protein